MSIFQTLTSPNRLVYVLGVSVGLLVFLTAVLVLRGFGTGNNAPETRAEIIFWGVFDDPRVMRLALDRFQSLHPSIKVDYKLFSYATYERDVIEALASGRGPDVWMIHHTWLPKHKAKLAPMPDRALGADGPLMTQREFQEAFVDVAQKDLLSEGKIYSLPIYVDSLALYWNRDLFNAAGIENPPRTWEEFNQAVEKLTTRDDRQNIVRAGAAIGSARNINRSTDILSALMLQSGVQMTDVDGTEATFSRSVNNQAVGEVALQYYTDFTNPGKVTYTWNDSQHYSVDAFVEGRAAMMFNYAHQIDAVRARAPRLNIAIAPIPQHAQQLARQDVRTYANYWTPVVSAASPFIDQAWELVDFLASEEGATLYLAESRRPAALRSIIARQKTDPDLGVFADQALTAQSWFQADAGAIETIFAEMIDSVNFGRSSAREALRNAEARVSVLIQELRRKR